MLPVLVPGDVPSNFYAWDNLDTQVLDKIEICYGECSISSNIVRTYDFGYTVASAPNPNGTLTLTSMEVTGKNESLTTKAPTIQFTYQNLDNRAISSADEFTYPRLATMDNGAGGLLAYTYENDVRGTNSWYNYRVKQVDVTSGMGTATRHSYAYLTPVYTGIGGNASLGDLIGHTTVTDLNWIATIVMPQSSQPNTPLGQADWISAGKLRRSGWIKLLLYCEKLLIPT